MSSNRTRVRVTRSAPGASRAPRSRRLALSGAFVAAAVTLASVAGLAGGAASAQASSAPSVLTAGYSLTAGNRLVSPSGAYSLMMQNDGNLVEYGPSGPVWSSNTAGSGSSNRLALQNDGNLVMYTASGAVPFATGETGSGSSDVLAVQDDGNVVQYGSGGAVFATKSPAEQAIQWFYNNLGSTTLDNGYCERAVESAFGGSWPQPYGSAYQDWQARQQHPGSAAAPRGTLVFYMTSGNGHVAISLGNGTVISTSARDPQNANLRMIGISPVTGWFTPLLGWAPAP